MRALFQRSLILTLALTALIALSAIPAVGAVGYFVTIDTSSVNGTSGFLDFQLNPGNGSSQSVTAQIVNFGGDGVVSGVPDIAGDVSGTLPSTVTFTNTAALNEYFQAFQYGTKISFLLVVSGPAIDSPNGMSNAGSTFGVGLYDSNQLPILTDQGSVTGFVFQVDVNLNGTTTPTAFPTANEGPSVATFSPTLSPEDLFYFLYFFFA